MMTNAKRMRIFVVVNPVCYAMRQIVAWVNSESPISLIRCALPEPALGVASTVNLFPESLAVIPRERWNWFTWFRHHVSFQDLVLVAAGVYAPAATPNLITSQAEI
jgi:hypothetical protein